MFANSLFKQRRLCGPSAIPLLSNRISDTYLRRAHTKCLGKKAPSIALEWRTCPSSSTHQSAEHYFLVETWNQEVKVHFHKLVNRRYRWAWVAAGDRHARGWRGDSRVSFILLTTFKHVELFRPLESELIFEPPVDILTSIPLLNTLNILIFALIKGLGYRSPLSMQGIIDKYISPNHARAVK